MYFVKNMSFLKVSGQTDIRFESYVTNPTRINVQNDFSIDFGWFDT